MIQSIPSLQYGDLVIDLRSRTVTLHGREVTVSLKEFEVLHFMVSHAGWAMTKEQIYNAVWEEDMMNGNHVVTDIIYRLRKKLSSDTSIHL